MGDIDESIYDGEGDLRKTIVQVRHKRAGETKMMARYGTFACIVIVLLLRRQILITDLMFVTDIADYIWGESSVVWRNFRFL